jgi:four helix bundle protein
MRDFKKLKVWQRSHQLVLDIYKSTEKFPKIELYGLTSQIRRSAVSIPSNIAEGCGKEGQAEFARYLRIAMGSANELEYQLILSHDLQYLTAEVFETLIDEVNQLKKMLVTFVKRIVSN